jgi:hypothetical protein
MELLPIISFALHRARDFVIATRMSAQGRSFGGNPLIILLTGQAEVCRRPSIRIAVVASQLLGAAKIDGLVAAVVRDADF